jgi:hypothetical protein
MVCVLIIIQFLVGAALCLFLSFQRGGEGGEEEGEGERGEGERGEGGGEERAENQQDKNRLLVRPFIYILWQ